MDSCTCAFVDKLADTEFDSPLCACVGAWTLQIKLTILVIHTLYAKGSQTFARESAFCAGIWHNISKDDMRNERTVSTYKVEKHYRIILQTFKAYLA